MRLHKIFLTIFALLAVATQSARAQFDPQNNRTNVDSKVDTLKLDVNKTSEMLDFKIYNDAYDKYLRELQSKQRNYLEFKTGLSLTQTAFSNWAAGGNNSFSGRTYLNAKHVYTAPTFKVTNTFDAAFGLLSTDGKVRKSEDYFNLTSNPSWVLSPRWEIAADIILRSQFTNSFIPPADTIRASTFFAPAYLTVAPGMKYTNAKKTIEIKFSPSAGNLIMVLDREIANRGTYGEVGKRYIPKFINYFSFKYKEKVMAGKLDVDLKLESFWDYSKPTPRVVSENKLEYRLTRLLKANFYALLIYDETIKTPNENNHLQVTETFGLGIAYEIKSKTRQAPPEAPRKNYKRHKKMLLF